MVVATMWSESYEWTALGNDERQAKQALLDGWNTHAAEMLRRGIDVPLFKTFKKLNDNYDVDLISLEPGECEYK